MKFVCDLQVIFVTAKVWLFYFIDFLQVSLFSVFNICTCMFFIASVQLVHEKTWSEIHAIVPVQNNTLIYIFSCMVIIATCIICSFPWPHLRTNGTPIYVFVILYTHTPTRKGLGFCRNLEGKTNGRVELEANYRRLSRTLLYCILYKFLNYSL